MALVQNHRQISSSTITVQAPRLSRSKGFLFKSTDLLVVQSGSFFPWIGHAHTNGHIEETVGWKKDKLRFEVNFPGLYSIILIRPYAQVPVSIHQISCVCFPLRLKLAVPAVQFDPYN